MSTRAQQEDRTPKTLLRVAEGALVAITATAVVGLARLFEDGSFLFPVLGYALLGHGLAIVCRRRGMTIGATAVAAIAGLALAVSWFLLPETTAYGVPTAETLAQAGRELSAAWRTFTDVDAPAPVEPGFVLAAAAATWVVAWVADTAAFRAGAVIEAAVPGASLFVFGAALGAPRHRLFTTTLFLCAVLAYWLAQRALGQASSPTWMASGRRDGSVALLSAGARLGLVGVLAALLFGPALPGAGASSVIPWRASDRDGPNDRVTISPLVDIRARIIDQSDVEVFTVESEERTYWRLTSLSTFDGSIWSSSGSYREADGDLGTTVARPEAEVQLVRQEFAIRGLDVIWLPAAYQPVAVDDVDARYDAESGTLVSEARTSDGLEYTVESELAEFTPEDLRASTGGIPREIDAYLELPDDFSDEARQLAQTVVQPAETPYERARLLQDFFRDGAFDYDTDIEPGHGDDDLERFLFDTKAGYCEQFAGSYAAMARAVGLPSRVAVGFTPGELQEDGLYHVRGSNGHAWPEVYFAGFGWVPFEPTPGRGIPNAEGYTGVAAQQQGPDGGVITSSTVSTTTTVPGGPDGDNSPPLPLPFEPGGEFGAVEEEPSPWPRRILVAGAGLVGALALWTGAVVLISRLRRWRRRRAAATPAERVLVAWEEVSDALARSGAPARPAETPAEYAARATAVTGLDPELLDDLADATTAAGYAPELDEERALVAVASAGEVETTLTRGLDRRTRVKGALDPRPLLPTRRRRVDIRER